MDQFNAANNVSDRAQANTERQGMSHCFVDMANPVEAKLGRAATAPAGGVDHAGGSDSNFISFSDPFEHCGHNRHPHNAHQDGGGSMPAEHGHGHHGDHGHHGHHGHHEHHGHHGHQDRHGHHEHGGHHDGGHQSDGHQSDGSTGRGGVDSGFDLSSLDLKNLSVDQLIALGNAVANALEYDLAHLPAKGPTPGGDTAGGGQAGPGGLTGGDNGAGGNDSGSGSNGPVDSGPHNSGGGDAVPPPPPSSTGDGGSGTGSGSGSGAGGSDVPPPTDTTPPPGDTPPPTDTPPVTGGLDANGKYTDPIIEMIRPTDPKLANVLVDAHDGMGTANFPQFESLVAASWTADSTSGTLPTYGSLLVDASNKLVGSAKTEAQNVIQQDLSRFGDGNVSTYVPDTNLLQLQMTDPTLAEAIRNTQISAGLGLMSKAGAAAFEEEVVAMVDSDGETHAFPTDSSLLTAASAMQAPGNDALYARVGSQNALGSKGDMIVSTYAT
ncbi:MAG: hypothetical protein JSS86_03890 [Cyanobacteria bacterium SZAS LIN-2]|nr:hypothetical protein [Cyanobacteria bacterium SZAS LIN-2]